LATSLTCWVAIAGSAAAKATDVSVFNQNISNCPVSLASTVKAVRNGGTESVKVASATAQRSAEHGQSALSLASCSVHAKGNKSIELGNENENWERRLIEIAKSRGLVIPRFH
jgi:hypothetical protein